MLSKGTMINKGRLIDTFLELVREDSLSFEERKVASIVMSHLTKLGLDFYEDDTASKINGNTGNVLCRIKGNIKATPIVILAHMDTVVPGINKNPIMEEDIIKTDGKTVLGADDLAGVAAILELLEILVDTSIPHGDITAIFTVAEEKGLLGAKNLDFSSIKAGFGFVLDDGGSIGSVTFTAPSQNAIKAVIRGKAAHAGVEPEKGINAIVVASDAISKMKLGRINENTTANIGIINAGTATNIVCDYLEAFGEARSCDEEELEKQTNHMRDTFQEAGKKFGVPVEFTSTRMYDTYRIDEGHEILNVLKRAAIAADVTLNPVSSGGGSDTNILNAKGIPSVNISIGMNKVHTVDENIRISDMVSSVEFLLEIVKEIR